MAVDKLVDSSQLDGYFSNIASAIRAKAGTASTYTPAEMPQAIEDIPSGGGDDSFDRLVDKTISEARGNTAAIGSYAFYSCVSLQTVSFPLATYIHTSAFYNCNRLTEASFPLVNSIASYAFYNCTNMRTASFPNVTMIDSSAFYSNRILSSIYFPNVEIIWSYAFYRTSSLVSIDFPKCSKIHGNAFQQAGVSWGSFPLLTHVEGSAFLACSKLSYIYAPSMTSVGGAAFSGCSKLASVYFPAFSWYVQGSAFYSCYNLSYVYLGGGRSIYSWAFRYCYNLLSVYVMGSSITSLAANAFASTPISDYTASTGGVYGSIFVPASLYSSYLTATNWSLYSSRIVSVSE